MSILSVIISLIGLFGVVMFDMQRKVKEIAVRKVMGADESVIMQDFIKRIMILLSVSFILSVYPIYYIVNWWLSNFANRIDIPLWFFIVVFIIMACVTTSLVVLKIRIVVMSDSIKYLKSE